MDGGSTAVALLGSQHQTSQAESDTSNSLVGRYLGTRHEKSRRTRSLILYIYIKIQSTHCTTMHATARNACSLPSLESSPAWTAAPPPSPSAQVWCRLERAARHQIRADHTGTRGRTVRAEDRPVPARGRGAAAHRHFSDLCGAVSGRGRSACAVPVAELL